MKEKLVLLKQSELSEWRKKKHEEQNGICPVLGVYVPLENCVADHQHRTKSQVIGENNGGILRGCISAIANSWEGKVVNSFRRMGLHKYNIPIWTILRNLADYLEFSRTNFIHPSEKARPKKITKTCYNTLVKIIKLKNKKEKIPPYPRSGKLTVKLAGLFERYNIEVKYYAEK